MSISNVAYCGDSHADTQVVPTTTETQTEINSVEQKLAERFYREDQLQWFIEYKELCQATNDKNFRDIYKDIYEEELTIIFRCIETEVYDRDFLSKCNVASVILNRAIAQKTTGYEVITKPYQFAYYRTDISEDTKLAFEYIYNFGVTTDCMAFRSDICPMEWRGWTYQFTDKAGHHFYK
jgi:hypothetical protein